LAGAITLFGFYLRTKIISRGLSLSHLKSALKQGALFSILIVGLLGFQALSILNWWSASLLLIIIVLIELIFRAR